MSETITIQISDNTEMSAYIARPQRKGGESRSPGLIVLQEAFGVNAHIRNVADRFAKEGYLVIAPELYHRSAPKGFTVPYDNFPAVMPHMQQLTQEGLAADLRASFDWLAADKQGDKNHIGAIGYCMGGRTAYLANGLLPLRAAACYYGSRIAPTLLDLAQSQHGPILMVWGGRDKNIPPEQHRAIADALRAAGKPFIECEFSDADHGFFCDDRSAYHPEAAAEAWALTTSFLKLHLALT